MNLNAAGLGLAAIQPLQTGTKKPGVPEESGFFNA